jgi:tetratricopeptide (TPR) repeat protein
MPSVFLSHSSRDKEFVRKLAGHLEQDGDIRVWLDERSIAPGANIVSEIADGLDSDFVLLILSPDAVDSAWVKEEWTDAFWEQTNNRRIKLAGVLYRDCQIPPLLRNKKYFDLRTNHPEGFRQIRTWILTERAAPPPVINVLPSQPPLFIGRESELRKLLEYLQPGQLAAVSGMPGRGKTTLALAFSHRHQSEFERVYWINCAQGSLLAAATDLERQLGLKIGGNVPQLLAELKLHCAQRRTLLVLDNVETNDLGQLIPGGAASVLVTTRQPGLSFLRDHHRLPLDLFSEEQCFDLFRSVLGEKQVAARKPECKQLFERVGYLPLAVSLLASLIRDDVRYTIGRVCANLPTDTTAVIKEAISALEPNVRRLLSAMSACAPQGFSLSLAASLIDLDEETALEPLHQLASRSLTEELDRDNRRYRLHALIREAAHDVRFAKLHAEAVDRRFRTWETAWRQCEQDMPDLRLALSWAMGHASGLGASLADGLAYCAWALNRRIGHPAEALELSRLMANAAEQRGDKQSSQAWLGNQAVILKDWGRLEEALALYKKKEALCLELGNRNSLSTSYGNQAVILQHWGWLEEAFALYKKQEALCLELGNIDGLQRSYGNQAVILQDWGRLEEALALLKKQEALCLELGNKNGLEISYGNQAAILQAEGRLEEAFALYKKQEALCLELGNQSGLAYSYWGQGLLARASNDSKTGHSRLAAALEIFTALNMPRERDAVASELTKNQRASS